MRRLLAPLILVCVTVPALAGGNEPSGAVTGTLPRVSLNAAPLALTARVEVQPAVPREVAPEFFPPRYVRVTFPGEADPRAVLNVYPVVGLLQQYPEGGPYFVRARLTQLRDLLRTRPALASVPELPYLPLPNAAQVLHAAGTYLTFPGGSGVRYLTVYRQDFSPFLRREVLYTFQGLTDDGRYYVSFTFPVAPPFLPTRLEDVPASERHLGEGRLPQAEEGRLIQAYIGGVTRQLNALTGSADLRQLDAVVRSLQLK